MIPEDIREPIKDAFDLAKFLLKAMPFIIIGGLGLVGYAVYKTAQNPERALDLAVKTKNLIRPI